MYQYGRETITMGVSRNILVGLTPIAEAIRLLEEAKKDAEEKGYTDVGFGVASPHRITTWSTKVYVHREETDVEYIARLIGRKEDLLWFKDANIEGFVAKALETDDIDAELIIVEEAIKNFRKKKD